MIPLVDFHRLEFPAVRQRFNRRSIRCGRPRRAPHVRHRASSDSSCPQDGLINAGTKPGRGRSVAILLVFHPLFVVEKGSSRGKAAEACLLAISKAWFIGDSGRSLVGQVAGTPRAQATRYFRCKMISSKSLAGRHRPGRHITGGARSHLAGGHCRCCQPIGLLGHFSVGPASGIMWKTYKRRWSSTGFRLMSRLSITHSTAVTSPVELTLTLTFRPRMVRPQLAPDPPFDQCCVGEKPKVKAATRLCP